MLSRRKMMTMGPALATFAQRRPCGCRPLELRGCDTFTYKYCAAAGNRRHPEPGVCFRAGAAAQSNKILSDRVARPFSVNSNLVAATCRIRFSRLAQMRLHTVAITFMSVALGFVLGCKPAGVRKSHRESRDHCWCPCHPENRSIQWRA